MSESKFAKVIINQLREFLKEFPNENFNSSHLEELSLLFDTDFGYNSFDSITKNFINQVAHIKNSKNVIQNSRIENIGGDFINGDNNNNVTINNYDSKRKELDVETVIKDFEHASSSLRSEKNKFHTLPNSHIDRNETEKLLNFVLEKPTTKDKKVAFLIGNAGMGKTVIIRDLYHSLLDKEIPCLALKADITFASSLEKLKKELELKYDFKEMFANLSDYENVVLIIDQIDALSQTLSKDRKPIETYIRLIDSLQLISNIKIVVSCREYDLKYDAQLTKFQDTQVYGQVKVEKLNKEQILKTTSLLNIESYQLNENLIDFLATPLHLDVFCRVYEPNINLINSTITLQKLYDKLWKDKIDKKLNNDELNKKETKKMLEDISNEIYEKQTLTIRKKKYDNENINFLITENLLTEVGNDNIQFFHQTFFDYVFARFFVESEKVLVEELENNIQDLFTRSRVKQVINYLKYYDEYLYENEVRRILSNEKIRFHIKLIIIDLFTFYEDILQEEKSIFNDIIAPTSVLCDKFLNNVVSINWIEFLFDNHFELLSKNQNDEFLLARLTKVNAERAIYFLNKYYEKPSPNLIDRIVYNLTDFSAPCVISFLDKNMLDLRKNEHLYPKLIKRISKQNKELAFKELYNYILEGIGNNKYNDYHSQNLMSELRKVDLKLSYICCKKVLNSHIEQIITESKVTGYKYDDTVNYYQINNYYPNRKEERYNDFLFNTLLEYLKSKLNEDLELVKSEIDYLIHKKLQAYLIVALKVMLFKPKLFINEIYKVLSVNKILEKGQYTDDYLGWQVRRLIEFTFPLFDKKQQHETIQNIEAIQNKHAISFIWKKENEEKEIVNHIGLYKQRLTSSIPLEEINSYPKLKKELQELERLYGKFVDKQPSETSSYWRSGHIALPQDVYNKMSFKQWKQSFMKYNAYESRTSIISRNKVTLEGNAEQFHNAIKENPQKFISFIYDIINDSEVHLEYKMKAIKALVSLEYDVKVIEELFKIIISNDTFEDTYFITDVYEYFFRKEFNSDFLFNKLIDYTKSDYNFEKEKIISFDISGSLKGIGIRLLLKYGNNELYSERAFNLIEEIALQNTPFIRMAIVRDIAYLNKYNKEESLNIFVNLTKHLNYQLLELSIFSLQYMIHVDFEKLIPFFKSTVDIINNIEDDKIYSSIIDIRKSISLMLLCSWLNNYKGSETLFFNILSRAQENEMHTIINRCLKNIGEDNGKYRKKSEILLKKLIDEGDYIDQFWFSNLKYTQFDENYNLLKYFSLSSSCRERNTGFYEYLESCITDENSAMKCLQLLFNTSKYELVRNPESNYIYEKSVEVVIKCYNTIRNHSRNEKIINFALDVFDEELKRTNNQNEIDRVLELI